MTTSPIHLRVTPNLTLTAFRTSTVSTRITMIRQALSAFLCIGALAAQQAPQPVKLHVWVKAFIPHSHPTNREIVLANPADKLGSMIKGPAWKECFATDGRSFSSHPRASARLTAEFTVETDGKSATVIAPLQVQCGPTHELNCKTGETISTLTAAPKLTALGKPACADGVMQIIMQAGAANPLVAASPWIDFSADLRFDIAKRTLTCKATVGRFPAFEAYAEIDGQTWQIFRVESSGETPKTLFDLGTGINSVPVNVDVVLDPTKAILSNPDSLADFVRVQGLAKPGETDERARGRLFEVMSPGTKYAGSKGQNTALLAWLKKRLASGS